ncbi:MAG: DUF4340 domain-containing protein [Vicinamibacteria bacterium]
MNPKTTAILAVLLIALGAYIYQYEREPIESDTESSYEKIFDFEAEKIQEIEVRREENEGVKLERTGEDTWRLLAPIEVDADGVAASALANAAASLERERVVAEGELNLADFGLDSPQLEVELTVKDAPQPRTLLFGDETPTGSNLYATLAGGNQVFVMAGSSKYALEKSGWDLRDKRVLRFNRDDVKTVALKLPEKEFTLARTSVDFWNVAEPVLTRADRYKASGLVSMLESTKMQELVTESAGDASQYAQYGLSSPTYQVEIHLADGHTDTLLIGDQKGTNYYARNPDRPLVYLIGENAVNDIKRDETEYTSKRLFAFATYQASKLQIASAGEALRVYEKVKEDDGDVWKQTTPETRDMEGTVVDDLLYKLNGTDAADMVPEGPSLETPRYTITVWSKESENVEELVVGDTTGDAVYARRNGDDLVLKISPENWKEIEKLMQFDGTTDNESGVVSP